MKAPRPEPRNRSPMRRLLIPVVLALTAGLATASAPGAASAKVPQLIFPVVGKAVYFDDFGAARGQGGHQGNDLMTTWRSPAVAAEAGKVKFHTTSARAGCMLYLYGASGTTYIYIHLNNDLTAHNDNRGSCVAGTSYAPGLKDGAHVAAGQLVGYVGDSGDANGIHPHLHFEVHPSDGAAVSPRPFLLEARHLLFAARPGSTFTLAITGKVNELGNGVVELTATSVRQWPGSRLIRQPGLSVRLQ